MKNLRLGSLSLRAGYALALLSVAPVLEAQSSDLYVANWSTGVIQSFDPAGGVPTGPFATNLAHPAGITFGPNGILLVANAGEDQILAYDGRCGTSSVFATGGGLNQPRDITIGPNGNLFVANRNGHNILSSLASVADQLHDGWLQRLGPQRIAALTLLALAADRTGSSFYRRDSMARALSMPQADLDEALRRLLELEFVAHRPWSDGHLDGVWQLLPLPIHRSR